MCGHHCLDLSSFALHVRVVAVDHLVMPISNARSFRKQEQKQLEKECGKVLDGSLNSGQFYKTWLAGCPMTLLETEWCSPNPGPILDSFIYFCVLLLPSVNLNVTFSACSFANKGT